MQRGADLVRLSGKPLREFSWGEEWLVNVHVVQEQEKRAFGARIEPSQAPPVHLRGQDVIHAPAHRKPAQKSSLDPASQRRSFCRVEHVRKSVFPVNKPAGETMGAAAKGFIG